MNGQDKQYPTSVPDPAVARRIRRGARCPGRDRRNAHSSERHDFRVVTVVEGLQNPWSMAFLPGGDALITERPGRLRILRGGRLLPDSVPGVPKVRTGGQGGLLDVVPHPAFAKNRLVYLSYSKPNADDSRGTTAARARFENDRLEDVQEILEAKAWAEDSGHYGSRMAFDREGYLFVTIGDRQVPPLGDLQALLAHPAQQLETHQGKVLRLHDDGRVPADNPFVNTPNALPEIWSYGHRSLQGLAVHPQTNELWESEHGPQGGDEVNLVRAGRNYGWPVIGYGVSYGAGAPIHVGIAREGMEMPVHFWVPSIAVSGMMIYTGDRFPGWKGDLFSGGMHWENRALSRVTLKGDRVASQEMLLQKAYRVRDVRQGPDGYIYLVTDDRAGGLSPILRLEPAT